MVEGETKEFRGDGMGFHVVEEGKDGDKKVEVRAVVVLYAKVIPTKTKVMERETWRNRQGVEVS